MTALGIACLLAVSASLRAEPIKKQKQPYPAIVYQYIEQSDPPRKIFVANVDLTNRDVQIRVSRGGADPDGDGPYQTTLQVPTKIADRENFDLVVNGDFFGAKNTKDAEGEKSQFVKGIWATVSGPAVTDGKLWGPAKDARPAIIISEGNEVRIEAVKDPPKNAQQVVAGSDIILEHDKNVAKTEGAFAKTRHPRTAVGIADGGKRLVLVVVDGRRPDRVGMQLTELADFMKSLGCTSAINLDGGGSSEMALRNPETGRLEVMNSPSDKRERAVANVLGISIKGAKRTTSQPASKE
ncbi:MAG TPA: phosphodiester glycosidase family protein [Tepidisphaeraceae bacterium]|jgi:exopolysaccharide biosynthesis protein|nr:phosphodiester glycosidase family protein [Tepidisphaeraceae bacterium]